MEDIEYYGIPVYNFPYDVEEDDEEMIADNSELRGLMPFAIIGSEEEVVVNGEPVRARTYPWGIVEVDNPRHSDFARLRCALLNTHLTDLKEITHDFLYENYRTQKVSGREQRGAGISVMCCDSDNPRPSFSSRALCTATMRTRPFLATSWQTRAFVSRRSNCVVRRTSCVRLSSRCREKSRKRDKSCWPRRKACATWRTDWPLKTSSYPSPASPCPLCLFSFTRPRFVFDRHLSLTTVPVPPLPSPWIPPFRSFECDLFQFK